MIILSSLFAILVLLYVRARLITWTISITILFVLLSRFSQELTFYLLFAWTFFLVIAAVLHLRGLRRSLISKRLLLWARQELPKISATEEAALAAGTVGFEKTFFEGMIDWKALYQKPVKNITAEEEDFIKGPVEALCRMTSDWNISHEALDLSKETWAFLKEQGFFGLVIPKNYGGKAFSARAHSEILLKLYSHSVTLGATVAVPNSLGPAELLLHYGTEEQKNYYLPRLASGEEIPCFALTGPDAGSDASSMPDTGIVTRGNWKGESVLGIELNFNKRYITLAPIATLIGLAFKLRDPQKLLSERVEYGITCALIPRNTPGITIGHRHFPLNIPFQNGPIQGHNVFIPLDYIIGGIDQAGEGWRMLVECLSVGRSITLPSAAIGGMKMATHASSAYAKLRIQFHCSISDFEGVQEPLARMTAYTYLADAMRVMALTAIDEGERPSVVSGIVKYHATEFARATINDAMDIHGGKGICMGPHNYLARTYQGTPIGITVEGANILTRNLMIFGQGAIRCHPYLLDEMKALQNTNLAEGLRDFDKTLFRHMGFSLSNVVRGAALAWTGGWIAVVPASPLSRYMRAFSRLTAAFALVADASLLLLGGHLKKKEQLSSRLGDILSLLYMATAICQRFHIDSRYATASVAKWSCEYLLREIEQHFFDYLHNFPNRIVANVLRVLILPYGRRHHGPSDRLTREVAAWVGQPSAGRDAIFAGCYLSEDLNNPLYTIQEAWKKMLETADFRKQLQEALHEHRIDSHLPFEAQLKEAVILGVMTQDEANMLRMAEEERQQIIQVDHFSADALFPKQLFEK